MKNEIEQQIFEKMKAKDFGESMCNETKLNVLKWMMQQLRKHDVSGRSEQLKAFLEWFDKPERLLDHDELIKQYYEESL